MRLDQLVFGANDDPNANYSPIFYKDALNSVSEYFNTNDKFIIYGGGIDFRTKKMEPTVVYSELDQDLEIIEYFSPVFNVVSYRDDEQLIKRISSSYFSERAMGCSLYGSSHLADVLRKKHTLTINQTLEDVDQGNKPFWWLWHDVELYFLRFQAHFEADLDFRNCRRIFVGKEEFGMTASLFPWDAIIGYLKSAGVQHLFGLPSDDLKIVSSLPSSGMDFILCKDQRNAVFMAAGYALTTNQMSVCVVGKGPALSNTLTGLLEAKNLGAPLLLLALGTGGDKLGTRSFQEADQISLVKPLVKWAYRVEHVDRLVWAMERAAFWLSMEHRVLSISNSLKT